MCDSQVRLNVLRWYPDHEMAHFVSCVIKEKQASNGMGPLISSFDDDLRISNVNRKRGCTLERPVVLVLY